MVHGALLQDPFGLAGTVLEGQYRVDAMIGEGGFGVVYRGWHLALAQPIAIKALKGLDGGDPSVNAIVLEKFREEARLLYTLSQSSLHIVRALDFGATTMPSGVWAPFMILEWLEGRSLADDLADRRARGLRGRSLAEAFAVLEPVADGLSVAHDRLVAHRDVKPANIFLVASASSPAIQAKVLDFGIAKIMKEGESAGTKGTFASFTWLYATPEQLDPRYGTTGLATDVYAFVLLLTELLTDRPPVDEKDIVGIIRTATNPQLRPTPRTRGANVPDEIDAVCHRALAVDPRQRPQSVRELWSALTRARDAARGMTTLKRSEPASASALAVTSSPVASPYAATSTPSSVARLPSARPQTAALPSSQHLPAANRISGLPPAVPPRASWPSPPVAPPPSYYARPSGYPGGPPPGTMPPGYFSPRRLPFVRADKTSPIAVVAVVLFVLATLFAGSCAMVHACNAAT